MKGCAVLLGLVALIGTILTGFVLVSTSHCFDQFQSCPSAANHSHEILGWIMVAIAGLFAGIAGIASWFIRR